MNRQHQYIFRFLGVVLLYQGPPVWVLEIQLVSEKSTGRYFKVRLRLVFIMYIQNDTYKSYSKIF